MQDEDFQEFQRQLRAQVAGQNNAPQDDFLGLSPAQVMGLNRQPLEEGCVLRWRDDISAETLAEVPMLALAVDLMQQLTEKPLKLTSKGNLPRKVVQELYATGLIPQADIETGITKLSSEDDYNAVITLKHLLGILGWTKKRHGKLSLTAKGKKVLAGPRKLMLQRLFTHHLQKFNLAYFDGYDDGGQLQHFFGFILVCLLKKGTEYRPVNQYGKLLLRAFPMLVQDFPECKWSTPEKDFVGAASVRFFDRSLPFYGLLRFREERPSFLKQTEEVMATDLFRSLFRLDGAATKPEPPGYEDAQIRSALFDAEMGGHSWTSGELPPELQELFHEQVRAFHAAEGAGRVTIGSLVPELPIKDAASFANEQEAIEAIREVLAALQAQHVIFEPPHYLAPTQIYQFLTTDFLRHEIPPPNPMLPAFIPLEEVDSELAAPPATVLISEAFLIALFSLEVPMPEDLFHKVMRLDGEVVPRALALARADSWRERWASLRPLRFASGPTQEADGFTYQFVQCSFETTDTEGSTQTHEWTGVVQLLWVEDDWKVYGGSFEGDEGGFGF